MLVGGGLGNAVLFSIARAFKAMGSTVLYFAGYKNGADLFKQDDIERYTDQVIWCTDTGVEIAARRPGDAHFRGNIVQAMIAYGKGEVGQPKVKMSSVNRIIAIGSDRMMNAVREARHGVLAPMLNPRHLAIGSINSPMQCMMKEVCAQCLQKHKDPTTGKETVVFSCFNQDQDLDAVDFQHLHERLRANSMQEKIANAWLDHLVAKDPSILRI
jgi:NAD(P)H-flavin reductase